MTRRGYITDSKNGYFRPTDPITRAEIVNILSNMVDVLEDNGRGWLRIRCLLGTGWCSAQYIDWSRHDK